MGHSRTNSVVAVEVESAAGNRFVIVAAILLFGDLFWATQQDNTGWEFYYSDDDVIIVWCPFVQDNEIMSMTGPVVVGGDMSFVVGGNKKIDKSAWRL